jgi:HNH endonuclease
MPPKKRKISRRSASPPPASPSPERVRVRPRMDPLQVAHAGQETISSNPSHQIRFRHPGYPDSNNILLKLPAFDHPEGGFHHDTAITACGIVAGNRWNGWLTESREGPPIVLGPDGILSGSNYYFHLPLPSDPPYGVVPCFRMWEFPHEKLPPTWKQSLSLIGHSSQPLSTPSNLTQNVISRDGSCRISTFPEGTEVAHIIPKAEINWFLSNGMNSYYRSRVLNMDGAENSLLLRADLHMSFDARKFAFVPKDTTSNSPAFVTHILRESQTLSLLFQNVPLQTLADIPVEFLFARFAWAILPEAESFFTGREQIGILVNGAYERMDPEKCRELIKDSKPRAQSPSDSINSSPGEETYFQCATTCKWE